MLLILAVIGLVTVQGLLTDSEQDRCCQKHFDGTSYCQHSPAVKPADRVCHGAGGLNCNSCGERDEDLLVAETRQRAHCDGECIKVSGNKESYCNTATMKCAFVNKDCDVCMPVRNGGKVDVAARYQGRQVTPGQGQPNSREVVYTGGRGDRSDPRTGSWKVPASPRRGHYEQVQPDRDEFGGRTSKYVEQSTRDGEQSGRKKDPRVVVRSRRDDRFEDEGELEEFGFKSHGDHKVHYRVSTKSRPDTTYRKSDSRPGRVGSDPRSESRRRPDPRSEWEYEEERIFDPRSGKSEHRPERRRDPRSEWRRKSESEDEPERSFIPRSSKSEYRPERSESKSGKSKMRGSSLRKENDPFDHDEAVALASRDEVFAYGHGGAYEYDEEPLTAKVNSRNGKADVIVDNDFMTVEAEGTGGPDQDVGAIAVDQKMKVKSVISGGRITAESSAREGNTRNVSTKATSPYGEAINRVEGNEAYVEAVRKHDRGFTVRSGRRTVRIDDHR